MSLLPELKNYFGLWFYKDFAPTVLVNLPPIPLPPLAEQQRIVAKVDELMRWCDALEARLAATRELGTKLLDSLIHHTLNP